MANVTVYGIPNCDTVKKARKWLEERGVDHTFVDFRANPVGAKRVTAWVTALGSKAMRNSSGGAYRALPDAKKTWDDTTWATHFAAEPMLIKRPVVEVDGAAVMAGFRKPETLAEALG